MIADDQHDQQYKQLRRVLNHVTIYRVFAYKRSKDFLFEITIGFGKNTVSDLMTEIRNHV